jgi:site-specific recombinase XerD
MATRSVRNTTEQHRNPGTPNPRSRSKQTAIEQAWVAQQRTPNTRIAYRSDIETFSRWCVQRGSMPLHVDAATLIAFEAARQEAGDSPSTLKRRWASLSSFYRFAVDTDALRVNPVDAVERTSPAVLRSSTTEVLASSSVDAYLVAAAALDPRLEALVALLVYDGLKLGEALALDVDDVAGRPPKVSLVLRRRGAQQRIELTEPGGRAVRRCAGRRRGEPLFISARSNGPSRSSQRLTRFGADHLIRQLTAPGAPRVTSNELRRYHFATSDDAGIDPQVIAAMTGLADARGLRRYSRATDNHSEEERR